MNTIGIILAGGVGNRFAPFATSKPLFPFFNRSLLAHNLQVISTLGMHDVIIVVNPTNQAEISKLNIPQLNITTVNQSEALGMADAIIRAKEIIGNRPVLVRNSTDIVDPSLFRELAAVIDGQDLAITAIKQETYFPGGYLAFSGNRLTGIIEKPGEGNQPSNLVKLVFDYFPSGNQLIEVLERTSSQDDDVYEKALTQLITTKNSRIIEYEGYWQSLKYPWHVLDMMNIFLSERLMANRQGAEIHELALVDDSVHLAPGVKVLAGAIITGRTYIGPNTLVGNHALVRDSHIGADCEIGYNTEVVRSYIGDQCKLHTAYIGDSVLESGVNFGAGAKTANLRFDGQTIKVRVKDEKIDTGKRKLGALIGRNTFVGINSSLMPGIKISEYAIIGPHSLVSRDL